MSALKNIFPLSFTANDTKSFLTAIVIYLVIGIAAGIISKIVRIIPLIGGLISWVIGLAAGLYVLAGLIVTILVFTGSIKE
ncbi:MAG: hypothetical protein IKR95_04340 [Oscillospiraceae bacterium]|jgi:hypothetical protein|nr:hypothetical protein [Oscillospiraceae bacterium]MCR5262227.1 hypothetical protein [Clostridiales bacterium]MCR5263083.1 hypothetical protein [Clostridiales bacterium]